MGKYVKVFNTTSEYTNFITNKVDYVTPYVSLCKDALTIPHYQVYDPYNGYDYIEIGGLKWATMNVGGSSVTDVGLYFQWGDTQGYTTSQIGNGAGQKSFEWWGYKFNPNGDGKTFTKYNSTDGLTTLELSDDAAHVNMGGEWRMPTKAECQAFGNLVNSEWTSDYQGSGVAGTVCTLKTDSNKQIFFPASGYCGSANMPTLNSARFWTSTHESYTQSGSIGVYGYSTYSNEAVNWAFADVRCFGYPIRGVIG